MMRRLLLATGVILFIVPAPPSQAAPPPPEFRMKKLGTAIDRLPVRRLAGIDILSHPGPLRPLPREQEDHRSVPGLGDTDGRRCRAQEVRWLEGLFVDMNAGAVWHRLAPAL